MTPSAEYGLDNLSEVLINYFRLPLLLITRMESEKGTELPDSVEGEFEAGAKVEDSSSSLQTVYTNLTPVTIQDENGLRQVSNHNVKQLIVYYVVLCYGV